MDFVIDNGASTFIPLWSYIVENQVIDILRQAGKRLYVHTVITGTLQMLSTNVEAGRFTRRALNAVRRCFSRRSRFWTVFALYTGGLQRTCVLERCGVVGF